MPAILTVTLNPTVDLTVEVDRLIIEGKNRARLRTVQGGGGAINVARCVRRLGGTALALHTCGRETGARLDRLLDEEGLTHQRIEVDADTRDAFVVAEAQSAHSFHIVPAGAALTAAESEHCMTAICDAAQQFSYLAISGSVPPGTRADSCAEVVRRMRPYDTRIVLDIAGAQLREVLHERVVPDPAGPAGGQRTGRQADRQLRRGSCRQRPSARSRCGRPRHHHGRRAGRRLLRSHSAPSAFGTATTPCRRAATPARVTV